MKATVRASTRGANVLRANVLRADVLLVTSSLAELEVVLLRQRLNKAIASTATEEFNHEFMPDPK